MTEPLYDIRKDQRLAKHELSLLAGLQDNDDHAFRLISDLQSRLERLWAAMKALEIERNALRHRLGNLDPNCRRVEHMPFPHQIVPDVAEESRLKKLLCEAEELLADTTAALREELERQPGFTQWQENLRRRKDRAAMKGAVMLVVVVVGLVGIGMFYLRSAQ